MRARLLLPVVALVIAACAEPATVEPPEPAREAIITPRIRLEQPGAPVADTRPRFTGFESVSREEVTLAALATGEVEVFESPAHPEPFLVLPYENILGSTTVLRLIDVPVDGWAEVSLAMRPNGTTGWIRTDSMDLFVVPGQIVVDLSERSLVYLENGEEVFRTSIGIGSQRSPTPTGHFYVTDRVTLTRAGTPWGPHALGLSARSEYITEFNGGDGIIAIHGTSNPASIGDNVSLGCVRLHNHMIDQLYELVPMGTPVEIRA